MSLVAYDLSSDEENDITNEDTKDTIQVTESLTLNKCTNKEIDSTSSNSVGTNNEIILPKPLQNITAKSLCDRLPAPKIVQLTDKELIEEDDEFLHKKPPAKAIQTERPSKKPPVKIMIPSLEDFVDVDKELAEKLQNQKIKTLNGKAKHSSLLQMLPKPKSEHSFTKEAGKSAVDEKCTKTTMFIPDSVRYKRSSVNTEEADSCQTKKKKTSESKKAAVAVSHESDSDNDEDDNDINDDINFFCLNNEQNLPEISDQEIQAMVDQKTAKISENTMKFLNDWSAKRANESSEDDANKKEANEIPKQSLDAEAIQALMGSTVKRKGHKIEEIKMTELTSDDVLPHRKEWLRTALASSTGYQATGVLVDEEPASGTRRKHQITYLAHKAKANEAELQAMWAANRQNRRVTQSKYGF